MVTDFRIRVTIEIGNEQPYRLRWFAPAHFPYDSGTDVAYYEADAYERAYAVDQMTRLFAKELPRLVKEAYDD